MCAFKLVFNLLKHFQPTLLALLWPATIRNHPLYFLLQESEIFIQVPIKHSTASKIFNNHFAYLPYVNTCLVIRHSC